MRQALAVLAGVAALAVAACGEEDETDTFRSDAFPFTFSYPGDFRESEDVNISSSAGATAEETVAVGIEDHDALIVQKFPLRIAVTEKNLARVQPEIDNLVREFDPQAAPSEVTEVAGRPALSVPNVSVPGTEDARSDFTFIFDGDIEYLLNCQSTSEHADEIEAACRQALDTLAFSE